MGSARWEASVRGNLYWGFLAFFLGYASYYTASMLVSGLMSLRTGQFEVAEPPPAGPVLLVVFLPNVFLGLWPALLSWIRGSGLARDFGVLPGRKDFKVGLSCGLGALFAAWALTILVISLGGKPPEEDPLGKVTEGGGQTIWMFLFALFAFVGAPLTEELLVRGALWGALEHYRVPRYAVLLLTSLIFAFMHEQSWRMPILFVSGLAMGAARMITGRVGASVVAHATNNFLPALVLFFGS